MPAVILVRPIFSEKAVKEAAKGIYTFEVLRTANKIQIAKVVEEQFGVKVAAIRTQIGKPEVKRKGRYFAKTKARKKAIVKVKDGSIDLWAPPEESKTQKAKRKTKEEKKEK